ncbi:hypothetical protein NVV94_08395 [Pseudomonas sp. LS1212]|uniref:hypothetical protein n=1 Tax=Pseudomonas sp. LS1212 TaxID=2972478 RepID=UPI00215CBEA5|nr:hypothetical protein [Pseudomonas sp. LS1212]UVJ45562.1 hypothetical protein NVV94_08395 [Pseudomonas sp. LS1212]
MKITVFPILLFLCCTIGQAEPSKEDVKFCEKTAIIALEIAEKRNEGKSIDMALEEVFSEAQEPPPESMVKFASDIYDSPGIAPIEYARAIYNVCYAERDPSIEEEKYNMCLKFSKLAENIIKGREAGMSLEEVRTMITPQGASVDTQLSYASHVKTFFELIGFASDGTKVFTFSTCYQTQIKIKKT